MEIVHTPTVRRATDSDVLTSEDIAAVLRAAGEGRHGVRDHAMLLTLYHHGLRVSELCRLTLVDLDLEGRRLWVERLNRGRSGVHPVPEDEAQALAAYLAEREEQGTLNLPALFLNERRATLSRNAVYYLVRRAGESAGLARPLFPQLLRRSTGSKLVGEGHDVRLVQDYLGLRSARSVLRFVGEAPPEDPNAERFTALLHTLGGGRRRMTDRDPMRPLNPLKLAATLHWGPDDRVTSRDMESKRVLDHWLQQIEHFDPIFAPEYVEAPALLSELLIGETGHAGRMERVAEDTTFHHWGLCQHLLAESQRAVSSSAVLSRDLSELAVAVAMRLDPGHYHLSWTEDLRAKAWCVHADACRRLNRVEEAAVAMGEAQKHAREGTSSAELAARIEKTEMSLNWRVDGKRWNGGGCVSVGAPLPIPLSDDPSSHSRVS